MRIFPFIFLAVFLWCNAAIGEEQLPDISKMTDKELGKLPTDVLEKLPMRELYNRVEGGAMAPFMEYIVSINLARLMYFQPLSEKMILEAVKSFQRDIGQPKTGKLTMGQFNELNRRSIRRGDTPVNVPIFGWIRAMHSYAPSV